jgi:hypothetical protein
MLAGTLPASQLAAMRLIVAPVTMRWHREVVHRRWGAALAPRPLRTSAVAP